MTNTTIPTVSNFEEAKSRLRECRPLLLAMEAIGWLHMVGKAKIDFLQMQGDLQKNRKYEFKIWENIDAGTNRNLKGVIDDYFAFVNNYNSIISNIPLASNFTKKHADTRDGCGILGLFQAAHGITSGIEKNIPSDTSGYLKQDATHMYLSSALGKPERNLLVDQPPLLRQDGWNSLVEDIKKLLVEFESHDNTECLWVVNNIDKWFAWREKAVGKSGFLREKLTSTLAETRLPNNDVTLFDQSYVTAALFKSAVAGAILQGKAFDWTNKNIKSDTKWRLLTVGMPSDYYEARSVKIGDWIGVQEKIESFFDRVCKLIEVKLAVGSLLYRDQSVCVFSFPDIHNDVLTDNISETVKQKDSRIIQTKEQIEACHKAESTWLMKIIDWYAKFALKFEAPVYFNISERSRSLVPMAGEIRKAKKAMAVPITRCWGITQYKGDKTTDICPVCMIRTNKPRDEENKRQALCSVCADRRNGRLKSWLSAQNNHVKDTIWIEEVTDTNNRLALITMNLDIEPWLDGTRLDSLRAQAISEWITNNPELKPKNGDPITNPLDQINSYKSLLNYIQDKISSGCYDQKDVVLSKINDGYAHESNWEDFCRKIVEDRVPEEQLQWKNNNKKAAWLTHQLFRKLPSPGRIYRFQREAQEFFNKTLEKCKELAASHENRWRVKRLVLNTADTAAKDAILNGSQNNQVVNMSYKGKPLSIVYRKEQKNFITASNLANIFKKEETVESIKTNGLRLSYEGGEIIFKNIQLASDGLGLYHPVIPLECSPVRFRVIVPLECASKCVDHAIAEWENQFSRVRDRLPLRIGVVSFDRMMPYQAVVEASRNLEAELEGVTQYNEEFWTIKNIGKTDEAVSLGLKTGDGCNDCWAVPTKLPDGRKDVFYPYFAVNDTQICYPLDFQHPNGQVYRHADDLKCGDVIQVVPPRIATLHMDSAGKRFEDVKPLYLSQWHRMNGLWRIISQCAPSQSALRGAWQLLADTRERWQHNGDWPLNDNEDKKVWLNLVRSVFAEKMQVSGCELDFIVSAASDGILDWCMEWNISVLKNSVQEG